jgi:spore coat polysaccharide biosynthesis predicted glycosyltransferase SpsG
MLAHALQRIYQAEMVFLMKDYPEGVQYARTAGLEVRTMPVDVTERQETEFLTASITQMGANMLVVDVPYHPMNTAYFSDLRQQGIWILFLDDCRYISPDADVILNSSILAQEQTRQEQDRRYLLGPEYFIYTGPQRSSRSRQHGTTAKVVLSFGGSDPAGLTLKTLRAFARKQWEFLEYIVILGPGYGHVEQIEALVHHHRMPNVRVLCHPPDVYRYFGDCDLAICAGGRTVYELQVLQAPTIAIASIEQEIPVVQAFLHNKMIVAGLTHWDEAQFLRHVEASPLFNTIMN